MGSNPTIKYTTRTFVPQVTFILPNDWYKVEHWICTAMSLHCTEYEPGSQHRHCVTLCRRCVKRATTSVQILTKVL